MNCIISQLFIKWMLTIISSDSNNDVESNDVESIDVESGAKPLILSLIIIIMIYKFVDSTSSVHITYDGMYWEFLFLKNFRNGTSD